MSTQRTYSIDMNDTTNFLTVNVAEGVTRTPELDAKAVALKDAWADLLEEGGFVVYPSVTYTEVESTTTTVTL
ncbi:hypothetical protein CPT_Sitrop_075 [Streptomyces phage Sitrop]|uniref:Uncharacterized protein n=1 Tax=Streptomyces phage Sitrop TaxID=2767587 RepID=A0A873WEQ0_9CAUD|nr:hypothetical protein KGG96_gp64 [Streptomyces phage Sitrop]QPB09989.1 hypothetical protein CPT_Sitrop_075 [Streptomyces phage Sitrop]